jgi:benzoyl-CoA 2,3-dioxygenase component B
VTLDLFGSDVSSNAATFYTTGLKGRYDETKIDDDHRLNEAEYAVLEAEDRRLVVRSVPLLNALNEKLRDDYIEDTIAGVGRWNKIIARCGVDATLVVPHKAFNRRIGALAALRVDLEGRVISESEFAARHDEWLPSESDRAYVTSLMGRVVEPGKFANWIAPPGRGVNQQPIDFTYVRFA